MNLNNYSKGIQHIGIPTNDIAKTVDFYTKLGFENIYSTANGTEKVSFLKLGSLIVETYENHNAKLADGAIDHLAIDVTNIEDLFKEVVAEGFNVIDTGHINSLPFWEKGIRYFIIEGPNLERIEFCERLK